MAGLPAIPKNRLVKQIKSSDPADPPSKDSFVISLNEYSEVGKTFAKTICVSLSNDEHDAFMVPGSGEIKPTRYEIGQHYSHPDQKGETVSESERQICKKIEIVKAQTPGTALVSGYLEATYMKPIAKSP